MLVEQVNEVTDECSSGAIETSVKEEIFKTGNRVFDVEGGFHPDPVNYDSKES